MSQFTNSFENDLADMVRGQGLTLPANWYIAPGSAGDDTGITELTGSGLGRFAMARSLPNWSGTQGAGTTLASTGSSHLSSNNIEIDCGTATAAIGTVTHLGFFNANSGGTVKIWVELETPIVTANGVDVVIEIGQLAFTLGLAGGMSNYLSNKLIDLILRGQAYTWPSSLWQAALSAEPNNAGGGTEVGGGVNYARLEFVSSLAAWSATQAAGTTVASTGTGGRLSNNAVRVFAAPTGPWGVIGWSELLDASTVGNLMFWGALAAPKTIGIGRPLTFAADSIGITWA